MKFIKKFVRDTKAATAIEYGLIAALIAVAGITAMSAVGTSVSSTFNKVNDNLSKAPAP
jgi:pilus assembly protein Flp/PilA